MRYCQEKNILLKIQCNCTSLGVGQHRNQFNVIDITLYLRGWVNPARGLGILAVPSLSDYIRIEFWISATTRRLKPYFRNSRRTNWDGFAVSVKPHRAAISRKITILKQEGTAALFRSCFEMTIRCKSRSLHET